MPDDRQRPVVRAETLVRALETSVATYRGVARRALAALRAWVCALARWLRAIAPRVAVFELEERPDVTLELGDEQAVGSSPGASNEPTIIAARYRPIRFIAKGGMGAVYEVEHVRTGERHALKLLMSHTGASPQTLERFQQEARTPSRLHSEHVVRVTDAGIAPELDDTPFLVMDLLTGLDLEQIARTTTPTAADVVGWLRQVAPVLDKAHELGIIHRDLKPEHLYLTDVEDRPPVVKVLDFGIAQVLASGIVTARTSQIFGTPSYMAPEQVRDSGREALPSSDRYALGLIAYRLLMGESYHRGSTDEVIAEMLSGPMQAPSVRSPGFGESLDAWFSKACHQLPALRFDSVAEQIEALAAALGLPTPAEADFEHVDVQSTTDDATAHDGATSGLLLRADPATATVEGHWSTTLSSSAPRLGPRVESAVGTRVVRRSDALEPLPKADREANAGPSPLTPPLPVRGKGSRDPDNG